MNRIWVFLSERFCFLILTSVILIHLYPETCLAQIEMKETGSLFQNFNTLSSSGTTNSWTDNSTIPGWYWDCGTSGAPTTYYSDDGTDAYSGKRCYGTTGDVDRAIGGLCSSSYKPYAYGVKLFNSSTQNITEISVGYTGEQWRVSQDNSQQIIKFYYKITNSVTETFTSPTTGSNNGWTEVPALDFISPKTNFSLIKVLNGNDPTNRTVFPDTKITLTVPVGSYLLLRWNDIADIYDHGLAIDDVSVKWTIPVSDPGAVNTWTGTQSSDWSDSRNWSKAIVPGSDSEVEIDAATNSADCNTDVNIKNLIISNGAFLTMEPGKTLTVSGNSVFEGTNCLVLKSPKTLLTNQPKVHAASASYISNGTVSGQGSIQVERFITKYIAATEGWHFFSSPVDNPGINVLFIPGSNDDFYQYYEIGDTWVTQKDILNGITSFVNGLGYLVSYSTDGVRTLSGLPNNRDFTFNNLSFTDNRGWHLMGNPFPCGISWGGTDWGLNGISHVAKLLNSGGTYSDLSVGATIPAMNGFFIRANSTTNSVTIPISARIHAISEGWKNSTASSDKKLKLTISSTSDNTYAENIILLNNNTTEGYDPDYDSPYLKGMIGTPVFYSRLSTGEQLSTNCVPESLSGNFNFEFTPGLAKEYTLKAEISDDWNTTSTFILEDKLTNLKHKLLNGSSFVFNAEVTDVPNRFSLTVEAIKGVSMQKNADTLLLQSFKGYINVTIPDYINSGILNVYDLSGRRILMRQVTKGTTVFQISAPGFYLIRFQYNNGNITKKIYIP